MLWSLTLSRGSKQVRNGNYNQRDFFIVLPALLFSAQAAGQLFSLAPEVTRAKAAAQSVFSLHDEQPTIINESRISYAELTTVGGALASGTSASYGTFGIKGELEFREVSLHYESRRNVLALNNVSCTCNCAPSSTSSPGSPGYMAEAMNSPV